MHLANYTQYLTISVGHIFKFASRIFVDFNTLFIFSISKITLYARETVLDFYKNLGFNIVEKAHSLENVQHFLMERKNN